MMCQNCGKNPATTHIKTIVNGKLAEYDLCSECARAKGYKSFFNFDDMDFDFNNLLGSFIGAPTGLSTASTVQQSTRAKYPEAMRCALWNRQVRLPLWKNPRRLKRNVRN